VPKDLLVVQVPMPVAPSITIYAGDLLKFTSGKVDQLLALPGSDNTATASGGANQIVGMAMEAITTDANGNDTNPLGGFTKNTIMVAVATENFYALRCWNATAADSEIGDLVFGTAYQVARVRGAGASIWQYAFITTTTNGEFRIQEQIAGQTSASDYGAFKGSITPAYQAA